VKKKAVKSKGLHIIVVLTGIMMMAACKPGVPKEVIQPDDMEDILYDYHISQGMAHVDGRTNDYNSHLYFEAVLKKHGVTHAEFDSSLVYYYTRSDRFLEIYKNVQERLGDEAIELGASATEVERYSSLSSSGDTADVWEGPRHLMLMTQRPYHMIQFSQKADTSYHAGDQFLMTFDNTFLMPKRSYKSGLAYLAVKYENDSTVAQDVIISGGNSNHTTIRIGGCTERVKEIKGFLLLGQRKEERIEEDPCLLFIDRIRLIRLHSKEPVEKVKAPADTVKTQKKDSLKSDSVMKPAVRRLGERPAPARKLSSDRLAPAKSRIN